jgi:hypothetical protein
MTPLKTSFRKNNGFIGKLFSWSAKIFEWLGLKSNSCTCSKNDDKFTKTLPKNLTNYGTLRRKLVKNASLCPENWEKKY